MKDQKRPESLPLVSHGAAALPSVSVESYNLELRDKEGFIGDHASKGAFKAIVGDLRSKWKQAGSDPLLDDDDDEPTRKRLTALLEGEEPEGASFVEAALEEYARQLDGVIQKYLTTEGWQGTEVIVVGGGFSAGALGAAVIERLQALLKNAGLAIEVRGIRHAPDDAGLIGAAHLMPAWMLAGHDGIIALDIGGTNARAGIVRLRLKKSPDLAQADVWQSDIWRHADDSPSRTTTVAKIAEMVNDLIAMATKEGLTLAPVIGIGCPGIIEPDGSIKRGGQNLPGGNWESESFNFPERLLKAIPELQGQTAYAVMHNDAVVQGLSQTPFLQGTKKWAAITIGTGLGNASYSNQHTPDTSSKK